MTDEIRAELLRLSERAPPALLVGVKGIYRFQMEDGRSWVLATEQGRFVLQDHGDADCVLCCGEERDLLRILRGELDLLSAALQGRIEVDGDLPLAQRLLAIIRARRT